MAGSSVTSLAQSPSLSPAFCHSATVACTILVGPVGSVRLSGVACLAPCAGEEEGPSNGGRMTSGAHDGGLTFLLCGPLLDWNVFRTEAWVGPNSLFPSLVLRLCDSAWHPSKGAAGRAIGQFCGLSVPTALTASVPYPVLGICVTPTSCVSAELSSCDV